MISIIIPTLKSYEELLDIHCDLQSHTDMGKCQLILTCQKASASVNRNYGLDRACGDIIIQCDDDISGFFDGWLEALIAPIVYDPNVIMVSARLMKLDGVSYNYQNGDGYGEHADCGEYWEIPSKITASACIAFRKTDLRFREELKGSGHEDTAFCIDLVRRFPNGRFVIANNCKLKHANEQKNQCGEWNDYNLHKMYEMGYYK